MTTRDHWDSVYDSKRDNELSWTQAEPTMSLQLIRAAVPSGQVLDVGGGTSKLPQRLLEAGYDVAVLDVSANAIRRARELLGPAAGRVRWIVADVTRASDLGEVDLWHDRAVFHFLTDAADRRAYVARLGGALRRGAHAIIATFAPDGPDKCSGLPVVRYDAASLAREIGEGFELETSISEVHTTPWGRGQSFQYCVFRKS